MKITKHFKHTLINQIICYITKIYIFKYWKGNKSFIIQTYKDQFNLNKQDSYCNVYIELSLKIKNYFKHTLINQLICYINKQIVKKYWKSKKTFNIQTSKDPFNLNKQESYFKEKHKPSFDVKRSM